MNRVSKFSTLVVGIATLACSPAVFAQAAAPQPPAAAAAKPEAIPAKIGLIAFEQAVFATNEGQKALADVGKKFEPQKAKLDAAGAEIESLQKQLQAATTITEEDRAARVRTIDTKQKAYQRDGEDTQTAYQGEIQEAYQKVAQKFNAVMQKYASENGFTLVLDVSGQQSAVVFALPQTDVTRAVIDAYNTSSGVAAQPAAGPAPARTPAKAPAAAPRPATR
jgi:outer membrane protein